MPGVRGKLGDNKQKDWSWSRNKQFFYPSLLRGAECTSQGGRGFCELCYWLFVCTGWDIVELCCLRGGRFMFSSFLHCHLQILEWWTQTVRSWTIQGTLSSPEALALFRREWKTPHVREGVQGRQLLQKKALMGSCGAWFLVSAATAMGMHVELDVPILWLIF